MKKTLLQCAGVLLAIHLFFFWLYNYSPINIPQYVPWGGSKISLHGVISLGIAGKLKKNKVVPFIVWGLLAVFYFAYTYLHKYISL